MFFISVNFFLICWISYIMPGLSYYSCLSCYSIMVIAVWLGSGMAFWTGTNVSYDLLGELVSFTLFVSGLFMGLDLGLFFLGDTRYS